MHFQFNKKSLVTWEEGTKTWALSWSGSAIERDISFTRGHKSCKTACTKTNIRLTFVSVVAALHPPPFPPWVWCPQSWHQGSLHSPLCPLSGPRLPPGTGPVLAASEASWPNSGACSKMLCAGWRWFLGDLNQFPAAFHSRRTPLYILSQPLTYFRCLITMVVPSCRQFSPEMLTLWLLAAYWLSVSPVPADTGESPDTRLHTLDTPAWSLVTLILTRRHRVVSVSGQCTQQLSHVWWAEDGSVTPGGFGDWLMINEVSEACMCHLRIICWGILLLCRLQRLSI